MNNKANNNISSSNVNTRSNGNNNKGKSSALTSGSLYILHCFIPFLNLNKNHRKFHLACTKFYPKVTSRQSRTFWQHLHWAVLTAIHIVSYKDISNIYIIWTTSTNPHHCTAIPFNSSAEKNAAKQSSKHTRGPNIQLNTNAKTKDLKQGSIYNLLQV
jgi:hypothetical protein